MNTNAINRIVTTHSLCTKNVHKCNFHKTISRLLGVFVTAVAMLSPAANAAGYTVEELKALAESEHQVQPKPEINQEALLLKAQQFEQQSRNQLEDALSPVLKRESRNPQENATGVIAFVSLTMPDTSLRQLLMQSAQFQVPLIVRGVQPDGFTATINRMNKLIKNKDKPINSGFAINPQWFTQFAITQVPAFVAIKPGKCRMKQPCHPDDFDVVYGNVSMYDALSILAQHGDVPDVATNALAKRG